MKQSAVVNGNRALGNSSNQGMGFRSGVSVALGGSGTQSDPYLISSANDLSEINNDLTAYYKMTDNIDLEHQEYEPIGGPNYPFQGTFDGDGFEISNLTITTFACEVGMFSSIDNAVIKNLTISNAIIYGDGEVGILVGQSFGGFGVGIAWWLERVRLGWICWCAVVQACGLVVLNDLMPHARMQRFLHGWVSSAVPRSSATTDRNLQ
jgi:hypothetical protein